MIILTIRTDKPEAEIGLFDDQTKLVYETWQAHRQLAETIHRKVETLLGSQQKSWQDIEGVACFQGPGSFTGLPIVATQGDDWQRVGIARLINGESDTQAAPYYGADAHITPQKK
jgi:tRNA A37 threonylcarbamoyltransferase TsaD